MKQDIQRYIIRKLIKLVKWIIACILIFPAFMFGLGIVLSWFPEYSSKGQSMLGLTGILNSLKTGVLIGILSGFLLITFDLAFFMKNEIEENTEK